jgi:hypothetical protein
VPHRHRYEKYDAQPEEQKAKSTDPFMDEYLEVAAEVEKLLEVNDVDAPWLQPLSLHHQWRA